MTLRPHETPRPCRFSRQNFKFEFRRRPQTTQGQNARARRSGAHLRRSERCAGAAWRTETSVRGAAQGVRDPGAEEAPHGGWRPAAASDVLCEQQLHLTRNSEAASTGRDAAPERVLRPEALQPHGAAAQCGGLLGRRRDGHFSGGCGRGCHPGEHRLPLLRWGPARLGAGGQGAEAPSTRGEAGGDHEGLGAGPHPDRAGCGGGGRRGVPDGQHLRAAAGGLAGRVHGDGPGGHGGGAHSQRGEVRAVAGRHALRVHQLGPARGEAVRGPCSAAAELPAGRHRRRDARDGRPVLRSGDGPGGRGVPARRLQL
eukprot:scaffold789_cov261-Pinguiococcus_pyrenoidosus.AAC.21